MYRFLSAILLVIMFPAYSQQSVLSPLEVSEDNRYFMVDDEPFLWLGDTAWELFHVLDREESIQYLDNRAEKGFTVIQAVALAELNGTTTPNAYGELAIFDNDLSRINDAYFEHLEWIIAQAQQRGLYVALLPTWGDKVAHIYKNDRPIFTPQTAYSYGKYLSDRLAAYPVIWILGGDRDIISTQVRDIWDAMAAGIKDGRGGDKLMSYHPKGETSSAEWFHQSEWLSFNSYQSGHDMKYDPVYTYCREHEALSPRKPYVNIEPCYEDIPLRFWLYRDPEARGLTRLDYIAKDGLVIDETLYVEGVFTARDVRISTYWTLLSGAAGCSYGNNAVWQMFKPYGQTNVPPLDYWYDALDKPGAESMRYVAEIFTQYPLNSFVTAPQMIVGENVEDENYIAAARACDSSFALVYLAKGREFSLNLSGLSKYSDSEWFNPSNGERVVAEYSLSTSLNIVNFNAPPTSADWLLIVK